MASPPAAAAAASSKNEVKKTPISINDIIFPSSSSQPSISHLVSSLRRAHLSIHNRLASIVADASFVQEAASSLRRPLVVNERCGAWYVPPDRSHASAYFKSTDGHERAWKFSTRRLNIHLVDMIEAHDGIIIVDSTRRGKRMPDALSTTIPIWCAVLNAVLVPDYATTELFLPPHLLATTHAQITALLPSFVTSLRRLQLSLPVLTKPLRPYWITPESDLGSTVLDDANYRPVICLTASRSHHDDDDDDDGARSSYVQGAGDDTENWAHGLTPALFWANTKTLLAAEEQHLPDVITALVHDKQRVDTTTKGPSAIQLSSRISVCALPLRTGHQPGGPGPAECLIVLTTDKSTPKDTWVRSSTYMEVGLGKHKTACRNLRLALPDMSNFVAAFMTEKKQKKMPTPTQTQITDGHVIIACESGRDLSVGAALALSCYLFDGQDEFRVPDQSVRFTKAQVKMELARIMTVYPTANPNRQTLQSVNSFLMDWSS